MRFLYKKIYHFFSSNSRHGTHSPFVYKLADELIYKDVSTASNSIHQAQRLLIEEIASYYDKDLSYSKEQKGHDKILVIDANKLVALHIENHLEEYFMIIIEDIYKMKITEECWNLLRNNPNITLTIDLFYFGVIMKRREQLKENFKLRFPFWKY